MRMLDIVKKRIRELEDRSEVIIRLWVKFKGEKTHLLLGS